MLKASLQSVFGRRAVAIMATIAVVVSVWAPLARAENERSQTGPVRPETAMTDRGAERPSPDHIIVRRRSVQSVGRAPAGLGLAASSSAGGANLQLARPKSGQSMSQAMAGLLADPDVLYAEPNYARNLQLAVAPAAPNDTYAPRQWGLSAVGALDGWDYLRANPPDPTSTVTVAVLDTGLDTAHPDIDLARVLTGRNFVGGTPNDQINDDHGHGTYVTGILAAKAENQKGIAGVTGTWPVRILPVKVLDASGAGTVWEVAEGIRWAADHGAKVINLSFGGFGYSQTEADAVAYARQRGAVVVAAVGNSGTSADGFYPAGFPGVIGVGAVDHEPIRRASFSNYGSALDLMAPGVNILSAVPAVAAGAQCLEPVCFNEGGGYYVAWQGTSASTPFVAGAAALLLLKNPQMQPDDVFNRLTGTADYLGPADQFGFGLLQIGAALGRPRGTSPDPHFATPAEGAELWGLAELRVTVKNPENVAGVLFSLDGTELARVTQPDSVLPYQAVYRWDTSAVPEGPHTLTAQVFDAQQTLFGTPTNVHVTVRREYQDGIRLQVLNPDGAVASRATVSLFHRAPSTEPGVPYWYEPVYQGMTDGQGALLVPSSFATSGHDFTVVVYSEMASGEGVIYTAAVRSPGQLVLGGASVNAVRVEVSARSREQAPLGSAEVWVVSRDENGVTLPYPLPGVKLSADQGKGSVYLTEGRYDIHVRDTVRRYFLTEKNVVVSPSGGAPAKVSFEATASNTSRLTVGMPGPYTGNGFIYLWEPQFLFAYAIPVASGETVVVSNVQAKVVGRLWLDNVSGWSWSYLVESLDVMNFTSGDRTLTFGRNLQADVDVVDATVPIGQTLTAGVRFFDDGGFYVRDVQKAQGSLSSGTQTVLVATRQPGQPLVQTVAREWDRSSRAWVSGQSLAPRSVSALSWQFVDPELTILRLLPEGQQEVYRGTRFEYYHTINWQVSSGTAAGAYRARVNLGAGPLGTVAGSEDFLVETERPSIGVTAPNGLPGAGARVRLLARNAQTSRWDVVFAGQTDASGRALLPDGFQFDPSRQHLLQVEGSAEVQGLMQPYGLQRSVASFEDLRQVDGRRARPLRVYTTFINGGAMPGAELLAQPFPAGSSGLPSEQRPMPLALGLTSAGGMAEVWLDPGDYQIVGTFAWTTSGSSEGYWLRSPVTVPASGDPSPVWLRGEETGTLEVAPGAGIYQFAVVPYTDKVYGSLSFPFGAAGGRLYVTPDTYKPYGIVTRSFADAYWNYWMKLKWTDPAQGITIGPRPAPGQPVVHPLEADGHLAVNLTVPVQTLVPGFSTLRSDVLIKDGKENQALMEWVELRPPVRETGAVAPGRPPLPGSTVQNHWETVPFVTITPSGSTTPVARFKSESHFTAVAWPVPATMASGDFSIAVSVQTAPGETVSAAVAFQVGQEGVSITAPADGTAYTGASFTVTGRALPDVQVKLFMAKGAQPPEADFRQVAAVTATRGQPADPFGAWTATVTPTEGNGAYSLYATIPVSGTEIRSNRVTVTIDTASPNTPVLFAAALNRGEVRLIWGGIPGKAIERVLVYRVEQPAGSALRPANPTWTLPASYQSFIDRDVDPTRPQTFTYWVAYEDAQGRISISNADSATTPGLVLEAPTSFSGWVDLLAQVDVPEQVGAMRFSLVTGQQVRPIATVTHPHATGVYKLLWDTTRWPDGTHALRVESLASATATTAIATVERSVWLFNARTSGITFAVRNPDGTVAAGAAVDVWARQGTGYELVFRGLADGNGRVTAPGSEVTDLEEHLVTALSTQTGADGQPERVMQTLMVRGPTTVTIGGGTVQRVTLTARDRAGNGLGAAEVYPVVRDAAGGRVPNGTAMSAAWTQQTRADGRWVALVTPGTYDFFVRKEVPSGSQTPSYYLKQTRVAVGGAPLNLTLNGTQATCLTAAGNIPGTGLAGTVVAGLTDSEAPLATASVIKFGEACVTPGTYGVLADLNVRDGSGRDWTYVFRSPAPRTVSGSRLNVLVGGAVTAAVATDRSSYLPGETISGTVSITDAYGLRLHGIASNGAVTPTISIGAVVSGQAIGFESFSHPLPASAAPGSYNLELVLEAGPLGRVTRSVPLTIGAGAARSVEIRDRDGSPAAGARVWLSDPVKGWAQLHAGLTGADGRFALPPHLTVTPGQNYLVQAVFTSGGGRKVVVNRQVSWSAGQPVVTVETAATVEVTVQASQANGSPLGGAATVVQPAGDTAMPMGLEVGATGPGGDIVFYLDAGTFTFGAHGGPDALNGYWLISDSVQVSGPQTVSLDGAATATLNVAFTGLNQVRLVPFSDRITFGPVRAFGASGGTLRVSPGTFVLYADTTRTTADGTWHYWVEPRVGTNSGPVTLTAGSSHSLSFGLPAVGQTELSLARAQWEPGESLTGAAAFRDASGNQIRGVWAETCNIGVCASARYAVRAAEGPRFAQTPGDAGLVLVQLTRNVTPFLSILRSGAEVVREANTGPLGGYILWTVPSTMEPGNYLLRIALQTGPEGTVAAEVPFTVATQTPAILSPADGSLVRTPAVPVSGRAPAGAQVEVLTAEDGQNPRTAALTVANSAGAWSASVQLPWDGAYRIWAVATPSSGQPLLTGQIRVRLDTQAPAQPTLTATPRDIRDVALTWTREPGEDLARIAIFRRTGQASGVPGPGDKVTLLAPAAREWLDKTGEPGTTYTYWVAYVDLALNAAYSSAVSATTGQGVRLTGGTMAVTLSPSNQVIIGSVLTIRATGTPGHVAQALVDVMQVSPAQPRTLPVLLTEQAGSSGTYQGTLPVTEGILRLDRITVSLTHASDPNLRAPDLQISGLPVPVGGNLAGTVAVSGGGVLAGLSVFAWSNSRGAGGQAVTDGGGNYTITGLPPAADYVLRTDRTAAGTVGRLSPVTVEAGITRWGNHVTVPSTYTLRVPVEDTDTRARVAGLTLALVHEAVGFYQRQVTNASGEATFIHVPEGLAGGVVTGYRLYTENAAAIGYLDTVFDPVTIPAAPVCPSGFLDRCLASQYVPSIDSYTGGLAGVVQGQAGTPLAGVSVRAYRLGAAAVQDLVRVALTDNLGRFRLEKLPWQAGVSYDLVFIHPAAQRRAVNVLLDKGLVKDVGTVRLDTGGLIQGVVRSGTAGVAGVDVVATGPNGPFWAQSGSDGSFAFTQLDAAGTYSLATRNRAGLLNPTAQDVAVGRTDVVITLEQAAAIRGVIQGLSGTALAEALVEITGAAGLRALARPAPDGRFALTGLAPGTYDLLVTAPGAEPQARRGVVVAGPPGPELTIVMTSPAGSPFAGSGNDFLAMHDHLAPGGAAGFKALVRNNSGSAVSEAALWLQIPPGTSVDEGGVRVYGRQQTSLTYEAPGADGRRFVRVALGTMPAGESLTVLYRLQAQAGLTEPAAVNVAAEVVWAGSSGAYSRQVLGQTKLDLVVTTISGVPSTPSLNMKVHGLAPAGAGVQVLADDGAILGETRAVGGQWAMPVTLPSGPTEVRLTARAVLPGQPPLRPSEPLVVRIVPTMPALATVSLTAGPNGQLTASPFTGPLRLAAAERTPMTLHVAFAGGSAVSQARAGFLGQEYGMSALGGGTFQVQLPGNWTGSGTQPLTLLFTSSQGMLYTVPVAEILILIDPSGYVYELFPSAPIGGATATLEEKVGQTWVVWDAAAFGQVNPQTTDGAGRYGWDVPAGQWRVVFTRAGYEAVISPTVAVPPPKTDLNLHMSSTALPAVSSTSPAAGAEVSASGLTVTVQFSKHMKAESLTGTTVRLADAVGAPVAATVQGVDPVADPRHTDPGTPAPQLVRSVRLTPVSPLSAGASYRVTVAALVEDYAGYRPPADQSWTFSTSAASGGGGAPWTPPVVVPPAAPLVVEQAPNGGAVNVPVNTAVTIRFAAALKSESVHPGTFALMLNGLTVPTALSYDAATFTVTLRPTAPLAEGATYMVMVNGGLQAAGGGVLLSGLSWSFTTVKPPAPELVERQPESGARDVALDASIRLRFRGGLKSASVSAQTVQLLVNGKPLATLVSYSAATLTVTVRPLAKLSEGTAYTVKVTTGLMTDQGGTFAQDVAWTFTTVKPAPGQGTGPTTPQPEPGQPGSGGSQGMPASQTLPGGVRLEIAPAGDGTASIEAVAEAGKVNVAVLGPALVIDLSRPTIVVERAGRSDSLAVVRRSFLLDVALLNSLAAAGKEIILDAGVARLAFSPLAFTTLRFVADATGVARIRLELNQADTRGDSALELSRVGLPQAGLQQSGPAVSLKAWVLGVAGTDPTPILRPGLPVTLTLPYTLVVRPNQVAIYRLNRTSLVWENQGGGPDSVYGRVTGRLNQFSEFAPMEYMRSFTDMSGHWADADVAWMASRNIVRGVTTTAFQPGGQVTRAQMAALIVRTLGLSVNSAGWTPSFADVSPAAWYFGEVEVAVRSGLMMGSDAKFRPDAPITRQEAAVVMVRALRWKDAAKAPPAATAALSMIPFVDQTTIAPWAWDAAAAAAHLGLMRGRTGTTWNPKESVTRAEAAVILRRLLQLLAP